jgi:toxin ParE1/3/4
VNVFWSDTAVQHLAAIYSYVAQNSPVYATVLIDRLTKRSQQIAKFPLSGRIVPEFKTRQIREIIEGSYRIIYYVKANQIDIVAVLHGSQQIQPFEDAEG